MDLNKKIMIFAVFVWSVFSAMGLIFLTDYYARPGLPADVAHTLPSGIFDDSAKPRVRLLMFLHPHCECSIATLNELRKIIENNGESLDAKIFIYRNEEKPDSWMHTKIWDESHSIPGVAVSTMTEREIKNFGVSTSGQTLLYDKQNLLVFSGGISMGREHEGDSRGKALILNYLQTGKIDQYETPVFGCSLISSSAVNLPLS